MACGSDDAGESESANDLAVMQASGGTLIPDGDDFTLTLRGVAPQVVAFSDRPERRSGSLSSTKFVDMWGREYDGDPPNAALTLLNGDQGADTVVLELETPAQSGRLVRFKARLIEDGPDNLEAFEKNVDSSVPKRFDSASLFIDAGGLMQIVAYGAQDVYLTGNGD